MGPSTQEERVSRPRTLSPNKVLVGEPSSQPLRGLFKLPVSLPKH